MKKSSLKKDLEQLVLYPEKRDILFPPKRLESERVRLSRLITEWDKKNGTRLSRLLGFPEWWRARIVKGDRSAFAALLDSGLSDSLFFCFRQALTRGSLYPTFRKWLESQGMEKGFYTLASAHDGEDFPGEVAFGLFSPIIADIRKAALRRENPVRLTAMRILVHDSDEGSRRILWQGFRDTWSPIRQMVCRYFRGKDRERLYNELFRLMIGDPSRPVRIEARSRISADFSDLYQINPENLSGYERIHALEHLDIRFSADENAALGFLRSDNREERLTAAHFLERTGTLERILLQSSMGNRRQLELNAELLKGAVDVGVCRFLDLLKASREPGILWMGLTLLKEDRAGHLLSSLVAAVVDQNPDKPETPELLKMTTELLKNCGDRDSFRILAEALPRFESHPHVLVLLLDSLPEAGAPYFRDILFTWLKKEGFPYRTRIEETLGKWPHDLVLEECYTLLHEPEKWPVEVRKSALKILAGSGESCIIQNVLENLPLLEPTEIRIMAEAIKKLAGKQYDELVVRLLETRDTELRCTLIRLLPDTGAQVHLRFLDEAFEDPDTEVRIAAAEAVSRMDDRSRLKSALVLLHDPEPEVREKSVCAFAASGKADALSAVKALLDNEKELFAVKVSALRGLGRDHGESSLRLLVDHITLGGEMGEAVLSVLVQRADAEMINRLINLFSEALPPVRERLVEVFVRMSEAAEQGLLVLLKKNNPVLVGPVVEILEKTGFIPLMAERLRDPVPAIRMDAALDLLKVGTPEAVGYVLPMLRDVKKEIRATVLNGLKSGCSAKGEALKAVIEMMANDPDGENRKLAAWTIQRLKA